MSENIGGVHGCALDPIHTGKILPFFVIWHKKCVVLSLLDVCRFPPLSIQMRFSWLTKPDHTSTQSRPCRTTFSWPCRRNRNRKCPNSRRGRCVELASGAGPGGEITTFAVHHEYNKCSLNGAPQVDAAPPMTCIQNFTRTPQTLCNNLERWPKPYSCRSSSVLGAVQICPSERFPGAGKTEFFIVPADAITTSCCVC